MDTTTRRDLLAGLASLPAFLGTALLGLFGPGKAEAAVAPPRRAGAPKITPPRESVTRRG
jgi:hypothetical protein